MSVGASERVRTWERLLSRVRPSGVPDSPDSPRTPFQRDYDRIIYTPAFRRLAAKTQVFPLPPDDHVHSRLTHSLEVATVGRSLGTLVGLKLAKLLGALPEGLEPRDLGDCVAAASLAHDLGNPPFGHAGEVAIREFFAGSGQAKAPWLAALTEAQQRDLIHFEGNAQALRLAMRTARPTAAHGLDLTAATIAALVKYPCPSTRAYAAPARGRSLSKHGINQAEIEQFSAVAAALALPRRADGGGWLRHPLAFLTEAADDVAYTIIDFEDGLRLGHVGRERFVELLRPLCEGQRGAPASLAPPSGRDELLDFAAQLRAVTVNRLIHEAADVFLADHDRILDGRFDDALVDHIPSRAALKAVKNETRDRCYRARDVLKMEISGTVAIQGVLAALVEAAIGGETLRSRYLRALLPSILEAGDLYARLLRITDHVSGMTDNYVIRLFRELSGIRLPGGRD